MVNRVCGAQSISVSTLAEYLNICIGCKFSDFPLEFSLGILQVKLYLNCRNHMNEIKVHQSCSTCGEVEIANKAVLGIGLREKKP